jgi:tRNA(adenine34) deaminase
MAVLDLYLRYYFMQEVELFSDEYFMGKALQLAQQAFDEDEVPIGAVVVHKQRIIAKGYNQTEKLTDVTAHAEMLAITGAAQFLGSKFLDECTLYVTVEPCTMCFGAVQWARPARLVYGASEPKTGYHGKGLIAAPKMEVVSGVLEAECATLMKAFFASKR